MNYFNTYFLNVLKNQYADFKGRATRSQFWYFMLIYFIISIILSIVEGALNTTLLSFVWGLIMFIPSIAISARRLHDTDKSGWFQLLALIPLIGAIVLLVFYCLPSQADKNRFGEPVK